MTTMTHDEARHLGFLGLPRRMTKGERMQQAALELLAARNRLIAARLDVSAAKLAMDAGEDAISAGMDAARNTEQVCAEVYAYKRDEYDRAVEAVTGKRPVPATPDVRLAAGELREVAP